ncbi:MAG: arylesterase [Opitutaceae bacterium]
MTIHHPLFFIIINAVLVIVPNLRADEAAPAILFFGDSLTAGYGVDPDQAYPALIEARLHAAGYPHRVVNGGLSGETTAAGLRRIDWFLRRPIDVFVLALGGNDGLRGIPIDESRRNLEGILRKVHERYPKARLILAGMESPPNMGATFTAAFREIFPEIARESGVALIPFLLEGVGGEPELNLPDGIHPNPDGHAIVADNVWPVLIGSLGNAPGTTEKP